MSAPTLFSSQPSYRGFALHIARTTPSRLESFPIAREPISLDIAAAAVIAILLVASVSYLLIKG